MKKCLICKLSLDTIEEDNMETHLVKHSLRISKGKMDKIESIWVNESKIRKEPVEKPSLEEKRNRRSKTTEMNTNKITNEEKLSAIKQPKLIKQPILGENLAKYEKIGHNHNKNVCREVKTQLQKVSSNEPSISARSKTVYSGLTDAGEKQRSRDSEKITSKQQKDERKLIESQLRKVSTHISVMKTRYKKVPLREPKSEETKMNQSDKILVKRVPEPTFSTETPRSSKRTPKPVRFENYKCSLLRSSKIQNVLANNKIDVENNVQLPNKEIKLNHSNLQVKNEPNELKQSSNKRCVEKAALKIKQKPSRRSKRTENKNAKSETHEITSPTTETSFETKQRPMSFTFVSTNAITSNSENPLSHPTTKCQETPCETRKKSMFSEIIINNREDNKKSTSNVDIENEEKKSLEDENLQKYAANRLDVPEYIVPEILEYDQSNQIDKTLFGTPEEPKATSSRFQNDVTPFDGDYSINNLENNIEKHSIHQAKDEPASSMEHFFNIDIDLHTQDEIEENKQESVQQQNYPEENNIKLHLTDTSIKSENISLRKNIDNIIISKIDKKVRRRENDLNVELHARDVNKETTPENNGLKNDIEDIYAKGENDLELQHLKDESYMEENNEANSEDESDIQENGGQNEVYFEENEELSKDGSDLTENDDTHPKDGSSLEQTNNHQTVKFSEMQSDSMHKSRTVNISNLNENEIITLLHEELKKQENESSSLEMNETHNIENCPLDMNEKPQINNPTKSKKEAQQEKAEKRRDKNSKFIKEKIYFSPSISLTPYSCTTCIETFSSEEELQQHNVLHIF